MVRRIKMVINLGFCFHNLLILFNHGHGKNNDLCKWPKHLSKPGKVQLLGQIWPATCFYKYSLIETQPCLVHLSVLSVAAWVATTPKLGRCDRDRTAKTTIFTI